MIRIQAKPYGIEFNRSYNWAKGMERKRNGLIVRAEINNQHIGWGEIAPPLQTRINNKLLLEKYNYVATKLEGLSDKNDLNLVLATIDSAVLAAEIAQPIAACIRYGISSAIITAQATMANKSLSEYLKNSYDDLAKKIPINYLATESDTESFLFNLKKAVARGQDTVKIKCSADKDLTLKKIQITRRHFPNIKIRLDPNQSWDQPIALQIANVAAPYNIDYIEDPLPENASIYDYAWLSKNTVIPIAMDEPVTNIEQVQSIIDHKSCRVLILKPQRLGGIDRVIDIIRLAQQAKLRCVITSSIETTVGIHLALHTAALFKDMLEPCGLGTSGLFNNDVAQPPKIVSGYIDVPDTPGLGIDPQQWWYQCDINGLD